MVRPQWTPVTSVVAIRVTWLTTVFMFALLASTQRARGMGFVLVPDLRVDPRAHDRLRGGVPLGARLPRDRRHADREQ